MNAKVLRERIREMDLETLFQRIEKYSDSRKIVTNFVNILNIEDRSPYYENLSDLKSKPEAFRKACIMYLDEMVDNLAYYRLIEFARAIG
jgi:hypothetical protein